jgi:D-alanyl-D-alanine dipeptidase
MPPECGNSETCLANSWKERKIARSMHVRLFLTPLLFLVALLCLAGCASERQEERRSALVVSNAALLAPQYDLVDVRSYIPGVSVELRYATNHNIVKESIYPANMPCLLRTRTAEKLQRVQQILSQYGCGLRLWDAWRPPEVQLILHENDHGDLFMDPKSGWSRHCSGTAVDVTLVDAHGKELHMPTSHDEAGPRASYLYKGSDERIMRNLHRLQAAMVEAGFQILDTEWWHFDDAFYAQHPAPIVFGHQLGIHISAPPP